jgi:uncharacterized membrane protein
MKTAEELHFLGVGVILLLGLYWMRLPRVSRPEIFFAVTVPGDFWKQPQAQRLLAGYRWSVLAATALAVGLALAWASPAALPVSLLVQTGLTLLAYLAVHERARRFGVEPSAVREAALVLRHLELPGGAVGQALPFLILAAAALLLRLHWSTLPAEWPVHWDALGHPNRWATKSVRGAFAPLLTGLVACLVVAFLARAASLYAPRVHASEAAATLEQLRHRQILKILLAAEYFLAAIFAWAALLPLRPDPARPPGMSFLAASTLGLFGVLLWLIRPLALPAPRPPEASLPAGDRTADRHWKLGIFYVNPDDEAMLVEKRWGIGYTLNLGHPRIRMLLAALLALAVCTAAVVLR